MTQDVRPAESSRLSQQDWLRLGLDSLREKGLAGMTIEALCQRAGKTRGSFYAHFDGIDQFLAALARHWRQEFTQVLIDQANLRRKPAERLDHLNQLAVRLDRDIEQGMRRLASVDSGVAAVCADVDQRRTDYLAGLYEASGKYGRDDARILAQIEYAAFVGLQQIIPHASAAQMRNMYQGFLRLTGRS